MRLGIILIFLVYVQSEATDEEEYFNCRYSYSSVFAPVIQVDSIVGSKTDIKHVLILPRRFCKDIFESARIRKKIKEGHGCVADNGNGIEIDISKFEKDEYRFIETIEFDCQGNSVAYTNNKKGAFKIIFNEDIAKEFERIEAKVDFQNKKIGYLLRPDVLPKFISEF